MKQEKRLMVKNSKRKMQEIYKKTIIDFKIYKITCLVNNKIYIGVTSGTLKKRWTEHIIAAKNKQTKLYRSMRKYGVDNFIIEQIASASSLEDMFNLEIKMIKDFDSYKNGLNSTIGGEGVIGYKFTDEVRKKMSVNRLILWENPEYRELISKRQSEAWKKRTPEQLEAHKKRAILVGANLRKRKRSKKPKPIKWKGKGWNMKIKTHCPQGHPYSPENTYSKNSKWRECLTCKRVRRNVARDKRVKQKRDII